MSSQPQAAPAGSAKKESNEDLLKALMPPPVEMEDSLSKEQVDAAWTKMYKLAGIGNNEKETKGFRWAVYQYALANGTSREGAYAARFTMYDGRSFPAATIVQAVGRMELRKFFRGNMKESYELLKVTDCSINCARTVARCATAGISATDAFAVADWLDDCSYFTPSESNVHETYKTWAIKRARLARGDKSLEQVESGRMDEALRAQGPMTTPSHGAIEF